MAGSDRARVEDLLASGLGRDCLDSQETANTALHWAASFSDKEMVELLLHHGFPVDEVNREGCTALHDAVARGEEGVVRALLGAGAGPDRLATGGRQVGASPRHLAEKRGKLVHLFPALTNGVHQPEEEEAVTAPPLEEAVEEPPTLPSISDPLLTKLWPPPRHLQELAGQGPCPLPPLLQLVVVRPAPPLTVHSLVDTWDTHREELEAAGHSLGLRGVEGESCRVGPGEIEVSLSRELGREEYSLTIAPAGVRMMAGDTAGLHNAIYTLIQLVRLYPGSELPALVVRDFPALPVRAVLLDLAPYGRLPTLATLTHTLLTLSRLKVNQVQLFARLSLSPSWQLPYTEGELLALDRLCSDREVSLLPALDLHQPCPAQDLSLLTPVFSRILTCFSSLSSLHLGPCLSSVLLSSPSLLSSLHSLLSLPPSSTIYLCSNSLPPASLPPLPPCLGLVEYGFPASHPWATTILSRASLGLPLLLCPGTAAWSCLLGRPNTMQVNIEAAARAAHSQGARGLLVAHWAGAPALAPLVGALPGWVLGAGLAWGPHCSVGGLGEALSRHVLQDGAGSAGQVTLPASPASLLLPAGAARPGCRRVLPGPSLPPALPPPLPGDEAQLCRAGGQGTRPAQQDSRGKEVGPGLLASAQIQCSANSSLFANNS